MRQLRLQGVKTRLNYSSEDVDEEIKIEAPPRILSEPPREAKEQGVEGIPPLLAAHLHGIERMRRALSPREKPTSSMKTKESQVKIKSLVKFVSTELPRSYDELMEKVYSWLQAKETASEGRSITFMDSNARKKAPEGKAIGRLRKEEQRKKRPIQPRAKKQIEEVVKTGKLTHLVKGIRKGKAKQMKTQLGEWAVPDIKVESIAKAKKELILMIWVIKQSTFCRSSLHKRACVRKASRKSPVRWRIAIAELGMIPSTMHSTVLYQSEAGPRLIMSEYQDRLVDKVFENQIGRNMEAYVDDMVIKSMDEQDMLEDIKETFERLCKINMKLNPKKCSFGMEEGQFLGHVVSKQGIKANPAKIQALTSLKQPISIKEV
uniref:Reverse transcriptase domain-containing protein n=1 Tax=Tanacetum cinerariifolium TaxID=118510 RepID=A0A6L2JI82_TANCI|nr:reverse transcriptase domain-containing protein [Tanacetum cinerariifolium]